MAGKTSLVLVALAALVTSGLAIPAASATSEGDAARATVKVAPSKHGRILVDARGRTLYLLAGETADSIVCKSNYLNCTKLWPPLLTTGKPRAGVGVKASLLGTVRRTKPAGVQVVYNRHPLYFYSGDAKAGDTSGQGYVGIWFVVSPRGKAIKR